MRFRYVFPFVLLAVLVTPGLLIGQTQPTAPLPSEGGVLEGGAPHYIRPETTEQRLARLGTPEDPGPNPDGEKIWWRFGKKYKISRYIREYARFDAPEGWVRPWAPVNFAKELYQMNDKYVWVWIELRDPVPIDPLDDTTRYSMVPPETVKYLEGMRGEFTELKPLPANVTLRFEDSSKGLPIAGSFRNAPAVADMNEDGNVDLILPPERGVGGPPTIYLGDSKGNWKPWDIVFPTGFNYGGVVAADFNKDKHTDLAFAVHLTGVAVFLGDGKGHFTQVSEGLKDDYPTRRLLATDLDADGWMDLAVISEGPVTYGPGAERSKFGGLRGYLNRNKGKSWEAFDIAEKGKYIGGDWLAAGDFNGDRKPDFAGSSIYFNSTDTLFVSNAAKNSWSPAEGAVIPSLSYYFASTAGKFSTSKLDDVIISFHRRWPADLSPKLVPPPPFEGVVGLDRISFAGKQPKRIPVARWRSDRGVWGLGRGDFDGDGNLDLALSLFDPREVMILLGDGTGNFKRAAVQGADLPGTINYDLTVADVNRDNRPDLIVLYESDETSAFQQKNGSVQVFLNKGAVTAGGGS